MSVIRLFSQADITAIAEIHAESFPRQRHSIDGDVRGYILWTEKSGFQPQVVLELEQIAVAVPHRKRGIGEALIRQSLPLVAGELATRSANIKAVLVSTRADNAAQRLYRKTLGAEIEATLPELYSGDEVLMVARAPLAACVQQ